MYYRLSVRQHNVSQDDRFRSCEQDKSVPMRPVRQKSTCNSPRDPSSTPLVISPCYLNAVKSLGGASFCVIHRWKQPFLAMQSAFLSVLVHLHTLLLGSLSTRTSYKSKMHRLLKIKSTNSMHNMGRATARFAHKI